MILIFILLFCLIPLVSSSKPKLTTDEVFNYTKYTFSLISPIDGQSIVIQSRHNIWEKTRNEYHLYFQDIINKKEKLITNRCSSLLKPLWFNQWIVYLYDNDQKQDDYYLYFYSTETEQTFSISIGKELIHSICVSNETNSLYYSTRTSRTNESEYEYSKQWNDVIQFREQHRGDTIFHFNIDDIKNYQINKLINIALRIDEMICSLNGSQLIFSTKSISETVENMKDFEIYSLDLNHLVLLKLTNNNAYERNLKSFKNDSIVFTVSGQGSIEGNYTDYQGRIYLLNLTNLNIQRWAQLFQGHIMNYDLLDNGYQGIIILGQLNTSIQIYTQFEYDQPLIKQTNSSGSYQLLNTFSKNNSSIIVFSYSSFDNPEEFYFINHIEELNNPEQITYHNELLTLRNLPKGKSYQWMNEDDQMEIEGILLYPPDKFEEKNLSLLVLIHGGPYEADLNMFRADWYYSALFFANHDWLVLQPNYRGSSGYGDGFLNGVLHEFVSRPGKDILFGVHALIKDGIADPMRLAIAGYSYGGYLTNWLITQTNIFNAALTGAGAVENVIDWGTNDLPLSNHYFLGSYPWEDNDLYKKEAAIYHMNKVCTPTHIVAGEIDIRVPTAESYLLERALYTLGIPTKLLIFPGVGHIIENNPWHEKIKLREELNWLNKYGHIRPDKCYQSSSSSYNFEYIRYLTTYFFIVVFLIIIL